MSISAGFPRVTVEPPRAKGLHITVWVVQVLLAAAFLMAGFMKTTAPIATLSAQLPWTGVVPEALVRFVGVSELLAAVGLLLPSLTRIRPKLSALAGVGLVTVMVLAAGFHASRGEFGALPVNVVIGAMAAFVAWARFKKVPIAAR